MASRTKPDRLMDLEGIMSISNTDCSRISPLSTHPWNPVRLKKNMTTYIHEKKPPHEINPPCFCPIWDWLITKKDFYSVEFRSWDKPPPLVIAPPDNKGGGFSWIWVDSQCFFVLSTRMGLGIIFTLSVCLTIEIATEKSREKVLCGLLHCKAPRRILLLGGV